MTSASGRPSLSRRDLILGAVSGTGLAATGLAAAGDALKPRHSGSAGRGQAGLLSPPLPFLSFAGFDTTAENRGDLVALLQDWTRVAAALKEEADGELDLVFGFGPSLFEDPKFGLGGQRPRPLVALPAFPGDALDPAAGDGDLCVQACATSPTAAHQAVRTLVNAGRRWASLRWRQTGFRDSGRGSDPRGMLGFRDGTANLDVNDPALLDAHLWVHDGPSWLHGGTYLVMRRIRLLLDTWDRTAVRDQERIIGRSSEDNRRLPGFPQSHVGLARPEANDGKTLLRRSFSYDAGVDPNGLLDSGLIFISFQRDPAAFIAVQRRLAAHDSLNSFSQHLASGVYACPPEVSPGSWIGADLLG